MLMFWKRNEKDERENRKRAEKEALERAKKEEEERESKRQARKLNFLITQTELYSHFVGSKIKSASSVSLSACQPRAKRLPFRAFQPPRPSSRPTRRRAAYLRCPTSRPQRLSTVRQMASCRSLTSTKVRPGSA
jgi:hypothetical protein